MWIPRISPNPLFLSQLHWPLRKHDFDSRIITFLVIHLTHICTLTIYQQALILVIDFLSCFSSPGKSRWTQLEGATHSQRLQALMSQYANTLARAINTHAKSQGLAHSFRRCDRLVYAIRVNREPRQHQNSVCGVNKRQHLRLFFLKKWNCVARMHFRICSGQIVWISPFFLSHHHNHDKKIHLDGWIQTIPLETWKSLLCGVLRRLCPSSYS